MEARACQCYCTGRMLMAVRTMQYHCQKKARKVQTASTFCNEVRSKWKAVFCVQQSQLMAIGFTAAKKEHLIAPQHMPTTSKMGSLAERTLHASTQSCNACLWMKGPTPDILSLLCKSGRWSDIALFICKRLISIIPAHIHPWKMSVLIIQSV